MPDNKQLIERLNDFIGWFEEEIGDMEADHPVHEAADEIERLEAERDAAIKQRDADYQRFSEAKDALMAVEKAAIEAQDKVSTLEAQRERDAEVLEALKSSAAAGVGGRVVARSHPKQQLVGRVAARQVIDAALKHAQEQVGEDRG